MPAAVVAWYIPTVTCALVEIHLGVPNASESCLPIGCREDLRALDNLDHWYRD